MLSLICAAFAAYRLAYDLVYMDGPFELYVRWRGWVIQRFGQGHWVTTGVNCPVCVSFWVACVITPLALIADATLAAALYPLYWLAVAGAALAIIKVTT
jgi:hypothetical protein